MSYLLLLAMQGIDMPLRWYLYLPRLLVSLARYRSKKLPALSYWLVLLPLDVYVKRAGSRILLQYATLAKGDTVAQGGHILQPGGRQRCRPDSRDAAQPRRNPD